MPTISVGRRAFLASLGRPDMTDDQMKDLCFEFGIELDDIVDETPVVAAGAAAGAKEAKKDKKKKEAVAVAAAAAAAEASAEEKDYIIYRIDVPANRYDLLCFEGLSRAMGVFIGHRQNPSFTLVEPTSGTRQKIVVHSSTKEIRQYCVGAVLRGVTFDQVRYQSFIDLQDKLHQNICRKRTLVAIGTHDLSTVTGPFSYEALPPSEIKFAALGRSEVNTAAELVHLYETNEAYSHLKPYVPIIKHSPVYPVIYDSNRVVLSMPPIINGHHSRISLNTRDVLIECTATDLTRASIVVNMMVTMFSEYCSLPFTVEPVDIVYPDGTTVTSPNLSSRQYSVTIDDVARLVTIPDLTTERIAQLLDKMLLKANARDALSVDVLVPPVRPDILHVCDVVEDVAVAYGFGNIARTLPKTNTVGSMQPMNKLTEQLREEIARVGFSEALNFALVSKAENFTNFGRDPLDASAVVLENPATIEFQVVRTHLLPGLLKTIASNLNMPMPLRLFEAGDTVVRDDSRETRARNERHIAAIHYGVKPEFETVHGLLDRVMQVLKIKMVAKPSTDGYYLLQHDDQAYFPGRCADVVVHGHKIGIIGILHPKTIKAFGLALPCSAFEIDLEHLL